ncbi:MAG: hypothetical protein LQ341_007679, partial [Variospora aurantia]
SDETPRPRLRRMFSPIIGARQQLPDKESSSCFVSQKLHGLINRHSTMQKWHVYSVFGRGRPGVLRFCETLHRQLIVSSQQTQVFQQGINSIRKFANMRSNRTLISRTADSHLIRSEQRRNFTIQRNQASQGQDAYRERTPPNTGRSIDTYYRSINLGAIDARDLAAVPNSTTPPPGRSIGGRIPGGRAPLDAQNLATRPPSEGPRIIRNSAPPRDDQSRRIFSRRDPSDGQYQGGSTNASHTRNRGPSGQSRGPRPNTSKPKKKVNAPRQSGYSGGEYRKPMNDKPSEDEMEYLQARERPDGPSDFFFTSSSSSSSSATSASLLKQDRATYTPADMSLSTLDGMGPALACGERGMLETVTERLSQVAREKDAYDDRIEALAQKWSEGIFCHFQSPQEKTDTLRTVERQLAGTGDNAALDE